MSDSDDDCDSFVVPDDAPIDQHVGKRRYKKRRRVRRLVRRRHCDSDDGSDGGERYHISDVDFDTTENESDSDDEIDSDELEDIEQADMNSEDRERAEREIIDREMPRTRIVGRGGDHKYLHMLNDTIECIDGAYRVFLSYFRETICDKIRFGQSCEYSELIHELAADFTVRLELREKFEPSYCMICQRHISVHYIALRNGKEIGDVSPRCEKRFNLLRRVAKLRSNIAQMVLEVTQLRRTKRFTKKQEKRFGKRVEKLAQECYDCEWNTAIFQQG